MTALGVLAATYLAILLAKVALAVWVAQREPIHELCYGEGVAILQPILSGDPRLGEVLADNLRELPAARFLWLVDTDDPVGDSTCREVAARFPEVHVEVLVYPPPPEGVNPKLWKLEAAWQKTTAPALLVLDDDTRMPAVTLAALVGALEKHDLATSLPGYLHEGRWPSRLLSQFVANNAGVTYLPLLPFAAPITINGMAYLIRRGTLEGMGGFSPLLGYLTDDLAVAEAVLARGGMIFQSARAHAVETTVRDGRHYFELMHRWFLFAVLLLKKQKLGWRMVIGTLHGLPPLMLVALVVASISFGKVGGFVVLASTFVVRAFVLVGLHRAVYRPSKPLSPFGRPLHAPLSSIASELLQPFHLVHALMSRRITWRKRRYRVRGDHDFEAL